MSMSEEKDNSKSIEEAPVYTRDELVYLCRLYDRAELHEEASDFALEFIKLKPLLNYDERNTFSNAFKNCIMAKRNSLRYLGALIKKETKNNGSKTHIEHIEEIYHKVEEEYNDWINRILDILDGILIPNSKKPEAQVFYLKLKGDYLRYKAEFATGEEQELSVDLAEQFYNEAYMLSEDELPITSITRIGLTLNFSLFYYEYKNMIDDALIIARNCYDEAVKSIDEVDPNKAKDYCVILQILKENSIFWSNEKVEEEDN